MLLTQHGYDGWWIDHSRSITRRTAYAKCGSPQPLLKRMRPCDVPDAWPHTLWLAPGMAPPAELLASA
jgi:hypothetical protein